MRELKRCPFCDVGVIYKTQREDELGTFIPRLFCNSCKMIFEIENDSPYLNDEKTYDYLKEKLHGQWNTRKSVENVLERLEERHKNHEKMLEHYRQIKDLDSAVKQSKMKCENEIAIEIIKEYLV